MIDIEIIVKAFKLAWISRLLSLGRQNWKIVPDYYFRKLGGLSFLLRCNYDPKHLISLPSFIRSILVYFNELKSLYGVDEVQDIISFNIQYYQVISAIPKYLLTKAKKQQSNLKRVVLS